jgi:hypothetical protein
LAIKSFQRIVEVGNKYNKPVSFCGEMASDPLATLLLMGLGYKSLTIVPSNTNLIKYLKVSGEAELRVVHCLIGASGARLDTIKKVYSHPQALGQCKTFLRQLGFELIPTYDTAGSVKLIKERGRADEGAIASARAGKMTMCG